MSFVKSLLVALIGSLTANLAILYAFRPFVIDPAMPLNALSFGPVTIFTVAGVIGAVIIYALMRRFLSNPDKPFIWLSVIVLIASFIPDYLIIGQTTGMFAGGSWPTALTLALMHVAQAIIVVWALIKVWERRSSLSE